jgi:hypothetical protein
MRVVDPFTFAQAQKKRARLMAERRDLLLWESIIFYCLGLS